MNHENKPENPPPDESETGEQPALSEAEVERIRKQQLSADFALGRDTKHLRLPNGIPNK